MCYTPRLFVNATRKRLSALNKRHVINRKTYLRILHDACYIWLDSVCDAKVNQLQ